MCQGYKMLHSGPRFNVWTSFVAAVLDFMHFLNLLSSEWALCHQLGCQAYSVSFKWNKMCGFRGTPSHTVFIEIQDIGAKSSLTIYFYFSKITSVCNIHLIQICIISWEQVASLIKIWGISSVLTKERQECQTNVNFIFQWWLS